MENLPEPKNQLSSRDLFVAFKQQLAKDFEQSNLPASFVESLEANYDRIHEKIVSELRRHEKRSDFNMMQLLYRIDISEAQLKKYLNKDATRTHFDVIAELIIKRVLQKVVTKSFYKNKEGS